MKIAVLDAATLGDDLDLSVLSSAGDVQIYNKTSPNEIAERVHNAEVVVTNKLKLNEGNLGNAKDLKLICVTATGYDNIDTEYCKQAGIRLCNIVGYSTNSVAQVTVATVLELSTHIREYSEFVTSGKYTAGGIANRVTPVFNELAGKTWGVIGLGNIGKKVAAVAEAFGCRVIAYKRTPDESYDCVDLPTLCRDSDIISIHIPLNDSTRSLIGKSELDMMKKNVILYNAARGAVTDEKAVAQAILNKTIGAFGADVYSVEPFPVEHPFAEISNMPNVCFTPHMAWASYEARSLCVEEVARNIKAFEEGIERNVVI